MKIRYYLTILLIGLTGWLTLSCSDPDYDSGVYWLKEEKPEMAAKSFRRSLNNHPNRWKIHTMLIEALSQMEDPETLEAQLRETLSLFPDRTRRPAIYTPATSLLGDERYNRLAASFEQHHLGQLIGRKGDRTELLAQIIMATCRAGDSSATVSYFERLITALDGKDIPDSVTQEMNFLIGPARVDWIQLEWRVTHKPDDIEARMAQLDAGLMMGDSASTRHKLTELGKAASETVADPSLAKRFGLLVGFDPFASTLIAQGWDGAPSPDGRYVMFIRDLGTPSEPDQYLFRTAVEGGGAVPIMKAAQQSLSSLAWPSYSPDGNWIYFYGAPSRGWMPGDIGRFHLYRVKPSYGARPQKLTDTELVITPPHFASDGTILLVRRDIGSIRASVEVVRLYPETRRLEPLSRIGEPVSGAVFTPAGDSLIFTTNRGVFRRAISGGNISVDLQWTGLSFPNISPDGRWLLLTQGKNLAILIDRTSGKPTFLGSTVSRYGAFGAGKKLILTRLINKRPTMRQLDLSAGVASVEPFVAAVKS